MVRINASRPISRPAVAVFILFVVWLGLALFYATGPVGSDDLVYFAIARNPSPPADPALITQGTARIAFWLPLRLIETLLGSGWWAFLPVPLASALGALLCTGLLARRWMGDGAMPIAVACLGWVPVFLVFATITLPDATGAWLLALGLLLLGPPLLQRDLPRAAGRCLAGGLVVGVAFSAKETVLLLCPALAVYVLIYRRNRIWAWRRLGLAALGVSAALGAEMVALWILTRDPLFHFNAMRIACRNYGTQLADDSWQGLALYALDYLRWMVDPFGTCGGWGLVYLLAVVHALLAPTDWTRLLTCCALVIGGYISLGTVDLTRYFPIHHQPRYLVTLLPIGALLTTYMVRSLWRSTATFRPAVAAAAILLLAVSSIEPNRSAGKPYFAATYEAGSMLLHDPRLGDLDGLTLLASPQSAFRLTPLLRATHGARFVTIESRPPTTPREWARRYAGRFVVVTRADRSSACQRQGGVLTSESREALARFQRVCSAAPCADRINRWLSRFGLVPARRDERSRIDVYRVPRQAAILSER